MSCEDQLVLTTLCQSVGEKTRVKLCRDWGGISNNVRLKVEYGLSFGVQANAGTCEPLGGHLSKASKMHNFISEKVKKKMQ